MNDLLTKSIGLLFSVEGEKFKVLKFDPPFIYATTGVFEVCSAAIKNGSIQITPYNVEGDMPTWDYRVLTFKDKKKVSDSTANVVLVANNDSYKDYWENAFEFANTIKYKTWIDIKQ